MTVLFWILAVPTAIAFLTTIANEILLAIYGKDTP
jgi:hypothetical protein